MQKETPPAGIGRKRVFFTTGAKRQLEVELPSELNDSRIESAGDLAEPAVSKSGVDLVELRVVPGVEGLEAKLEPAAARFAEHEALEDRHVPVVAARTTQGVVAERSPRANCRKSEGRRTEPLLDAVR